jgi:hypothetical protein
MSDLKFPCPACGQDVSCEPALAGTSMACPVCHASIIVPQPASAPADAAVPKEVPPAWPGYSGTSAQRTSGLAIASLVCSALSLVTCIGWLPGIICGHLAKARIRRDSSLKGRGIATAGLLIGYLFLTLEVGIAAAKLWGFSTAMKQGIENVRQNLATNTIVVTRTQPVAVDNQSAQPASQPVTPAATGWTSDITSAAFPDHPAAGKFRGMDFAVKNAVFRNGDLKLTSANGMTLDILRLGTSVEGQSFEVQFADDNPTNPRARMVWNEGDANMSASYSKSFGMKLEFGQVANGRLSAKIYLCFPDDAKSCIAGTIDARFIKPK